MLVEERMTFHIGGATTISNIMLKIREFDAQIKDALKLDLQPDYQRGEVWCADFKEKLIFSILINYPIGNFIIRNLTEPKTRLVDGVLKEANMQVVDGQQRLNAIKEFLDGELELGYEVSKKILEKNIDFYHNARKNYDGKDSTRHKQAMKVLKKFEEGKRFKINYNNLPSSLKDRFDVYDLSITNLTCSNDDVVKEYFQFVQNQERLRAGEIINSLPESKKLEDYLKQLENKEKLLVVLNWKDKRKEFDKIFYSMIGIFNENLKLGTKDSLIIDFVRNPEPIKEETKEATQRMIKALNAVSKIPTDNKISFNISFNKRLLKLLCLLSGFGYVDFEVDTEKKLLKLSEINKKLSAFGSTKKNAIKDRLNVKEDDAPIIEDYRSVAEMTSETHSLEDIKNENGVIIKKGVKSRMRTLAKLMEE